MKLVIYFCLLMAMLCGCSNEWEFPDVIKKIDAKREACARECAPRESRLKWGNCVCKVEEVK